MHTWKHFYTTWLDFTVSILWEIFTGDSNFSCQKKFSSFKGVDSNFFSWVLKFFFYFDTYPTDNREPSADTAEDDSESVSCCRDCGGNEGGWSGGGRFDGGAGF